MATAQDAVSLTIDGRPVTVPAGASILHAAAELGIDIPTLCYHPNIAASANCRLCLVEQVPDAHAGPPAADASLNNETKLLSACRALVEPGQTLFTDSEGVRRSRKGSLRALLVRCGPKRSPRSCRAAHRIRHPVKRPSRPCRPARHRRQPLLHPRLRQVRHVLALRRRLRRPGSAHLRHRTRRARLPRTHLHS